MTISLFLKDYHPKVIRIAHIVAKNKMPERARKKRPSSPRTMSTVLETNKTDNMCNVHEKRGNPFSSALFFTDIGRRSPFRTLVA